MQPSQKKINNSVRTLKEAGYIVNLFHKMHIRQAAEDQEVPLTDADVDDIAGVVEGCSWDETWENVDYHIRQLSEERS